MIVSLFMLTGCGSELPPEPGAPGLSGNYYVAIGDWATKSVTFSVTPQNISCFPDEMIEIAVKNSGDDYVYNAVYLWDEKKQSWNDGIFKETPAKNSMWIKNSATKKDKVRCDFLSDFADENKELFYVSYSCSKVNNNWDCHNNKWQLDVIKVQMKKRLSELPPEPQGPGVGEPSTNSSSGGGSSSNSSYWAHSKIAVTDISSNSITLKNMMADPILLTLVDFRNVEGYGEFNNYNLTMNAGQSVDLNALNLGCNNEIRMNVEYIDLATNARYSFDGNGNYLPEIKCVY